MFFISVIHSQTDVNNKSSYVFAFLLPVICQKQRDFAMKFAPFCTEICNTYTGICINTPSRPLKRFFKGRKKRMLSQKNLKILFTLLPLNFSTKFILPKKNTLGSKDCLAKMNLRQRQALSISDCGVFSAHCKKKRNA